MALMLVHPPLDQNRRPYLKEEEEQEEQEQEEETIK